MAPIWAAQAWQATHTGDVPVRVSSRAWNQGAAWQTVPDWQARGSTGAATRVTTDPRSVAGSRKNNHRPLCRESVSGKYGPLAAPVSLGHRAAFPYGLLPRKVIEVDSFRESASQNKVTAPGATGAVAIWGGNGSQPPGREGLPGRGGVPSRVIFSIPQRRHHRNTKNEQRSCARGTRYIGELGIVPPGTAMTASNSVGSSCDEMMRGRPGL